MRETAPSFCRADEAGYTRSTMQTYEVAIKSLLGTQEAADALRSRFHVVDPTSKQLNHYFETGPMDVLHERVRAIVPSHEHDRLAHIVTRGTRFSVRTRQADDAVLFVIKASIDDTTSENGISRIEFEVAVDHPLDTLDALIQDAGFPYQAKWSRDREEYTVRGTTVTIDRNAGYGYVAELEKVVTSEEEVEAARDHLRALMQQLGIEELSQDRLERMFAHYNAHWPQYYGTDKIFIIE